ncbi:hydroxymethylpyrimidine/phosphomethylpyrimidine kinase [Methylocaldum sp.]|uniref:bifunctional hydroxymethylpyrimidine kinase/phosphomethylpyrimidine kinase n=1 Tax=Methylocaldum sp. TaxID=1969727 RepID=UPI002D60B7E7|nr:hydroxymethylpyrimidine/phosphomethylpyrimidine kinase [Methylocaldum sp.]HYE35121.1 hydroxymethylpyrimidine/phosphomethylpyrimidine kinase [Methylocaldum sp.]
MKHKPPVVLSLSGHDPTGGAGIQADIETISRLGCHPCTVVTALTVQDTHNVRKVLPQKAGDFLEQARTVLQDLPVAAIKIGLLGSVDIVHAVYELLKEAGGIPVVLDPILAAGGGTNLANEALIEALRQELIPRATVLTPNSPEARTLTGMRDLDDCARDLLALGCPNVLLTGTHEEDNEVINRLCRLSVTKTYRWPRLPGSYHGSGCTLASALAALLAQCRDIEPAALEAQDFTWQALRNGYRLGGGQLLPNRFYLTP